MTVPYGSPSDYPQGDFFQPKDHLGALLLVKVHSVEDVQTNSYGVRPAARCDIRILDGPGVGSTFPDTLLFNVALVRVCRASLSSTGPGRGTILARLMIGDSKSGRTPLIFQDASQADMQIADAFLQSASQQRHPSAYQPPPPQPPQQQFQPPPNYPMPDADRFRPQQAPAPAYSVPDEPSF